MNFNIRASFSISKEYSTSEDIEKGSALVDKKVLLTREGLVKFTLTTLKKYGIRPRKKLGQHFLVDPKLLNVIVNGLELRGNEVVAEIGSGIGTLTLFLAQRCKKVIAIEIDHKLVNVLQDVLKDHDNVEIIHADVLSLKLNVDRIASNVPFNISSQLLEHILKKCRFKIAVLTFQLEFAKRLYAKPGTRDYSRITILATYYSTIRKLYTAPPSSFIPEPKVFTQTLKIMLRERPPFDVRDEDFLFNVVRELFTLRNKMLRKALRIACRNMRVGYEVLDKALRELSTLLDMRVYELRPIDFAYIANVLFDLMKESSS